VGRGEEGVGCNSGQRRNDLVVLVRADMYTVLKVRVNGSYSGNSGIGEP
jgi:hypothetical protein